MLSKSTFRSRSPLQCVEEVEFFDIERLEDCCQGPARYLPPVAVYRSESAWGGESRHNGMTLALAGDGTPKVPSEHADEVLRPYWRQPA